METAENASETLKIARNRSNLASADVTLQLRLGFWPVKSGQCSNVLPIVSVVGPNYQFQLLPTLNSMFLEILTLSPGVSRCRGCRAVSGGVEAVSRQCRLTPVSVCRAVSGCSVGAVSGLLDSGDVRTVSRCQAVSECRSVGVSGCRSGVEVSECRCPTQTASILSQSCKFRFLKSNSTFTTTYMGGSLLLWLAAAVWVDWLAVARRGGGASRRR